MKVEAELFDICKDFIKENKILEDDEDLENIDWYKIQDFIVNICGLIGYYEENDIEDLFDEE